MTFRLLTPADIVELHRVEAETYLPVLHESDEAFLRLIELFPQGAFGFFDEHGLCGYAFATPTRAGETLQLRSVMESVAADADTFYIHDVAVAHRCRGRGVARQLVERLLELARASGFRRSELVSVQGSAPFWERFGFRRVRDFEYAPGAPSVTMIRDGLSARSA